MKIFNCLLASILILGLGSIGICQQTGSIRGTVVDNEGNVLPGVKVTLSSPALQGTLSYLTTSGGDFRFPSLPPGNYTTEVELSGFKTVKRPGIQVRLDAVATISIQMSLSPVSEQITVIAPSPNVDVTATNISVTVSKDVLEKIPMQRNILDVYQSAPATVPRDSSNDYQKSASVAGAGLHESKISIDGVDLVDPARGYIAGDVTFDAIEEVEISVGGHKAEVGQASAGFLNVVTKSGGNVFSGTLTLGGTNKSLTEAIVPGEQIKAFGLAAPQIKDYKYDAGLAFGGPIIKDRVWFFIAPRFATFEQSTYFIPFTDPDGIFHPAYKNNWRNLMGLGKITIKLTKNIKWFGMFQDNALRETPEPWSVPRAYTPIEAQQSNTMSDPTASSVLTYILNQNTFLEGRFGLVYRHMAYPWSEKWEGPVNRGYHIDKVSEYEWGAPESNWYDYYRREWNVGLMITRFLDSFLGADHEFKAGAAYSYATANMQGKRPNPYFYFWNSGTPWYDNDIEPYRGQFQIFNQSPTGAGTPNETGMWRMSLFVQDSLNIGARLNVNLGFRYDESHGFLPASHYKGWNDTWENGLANVILPAIYQPEGSTLDSLKIKNIMVYKNFSPRIGVSYDLFGGGKTLLKASYSRYGEAMFTTALESLIPLTEKTVNFTWWDDNHDGKFSLPPIDRYLAGSYQAYSTDVKNSVAPGLKPPTTDEILLSVVQEISPDFSVAVNYMYRSAKNLLGTINLNIAKNSEWWIPYTVTDPGQDGKSGGGDDQSLTVYMLRSDAPTNFLQKTNISDAWRKYSGLNVLFNKRMSNGWMFNGSIALNKAWGNFPNGYLTFSGTQNFWDPNVDINRQGRLEYDRPLIIKLMASVELPLGFNLSGYFRHYSGGNFTRQVTVYFPSTLQGYKPRSTSVTVNAEAQGSRDLMADSIMDLRLEKTFNLAGLNFGVWADVYNLFGHWYFTYAQRQLVGGYIYTNGSYAAFPQYGIPSAVYGTRELALGARIRF